MKLYECHRAHMCIPGIKTFLKNCNVQLFKSGTNIKIVEGRYSVGDRETQNDVIAKMTSCSYKRPVISDVYFYFII